MRLEETAGFTVYIYSFAIEEVCPGEASMPHTRSVSQLPLRIKQPSLHG